MSNNGINNEEGQGRLSLVFANLDQLHLSFMPFLRNGGLFIPTPDSYQMGEEVSMLIELPDESEKVQAKGIVSWVTPLHSTGHNKEGVGVEFSDGNGIALRHRITTLLLDSVDQSKKSHTL